MVGRVFGVLEDIWFTFSVWVAASKVAESKNEELDELPLFSIKNATLPLPSVTFSQPPGWGRFDAMLREDDLEAGATAGT